MNLKKFQTPKAIGLVGIVLFVVILIISYLILRYTEKKDEPIKTEDYLKYSFAPSIVVAFVLCFGLYYSGTGEEKLVFCNKSFWENE